MFLIFGSIFGYSCSFVSFNLIVIFLDGFCASSECSGKKSIAKFKTKESKKYLILALKMYI